jgi:Alginate lyase
MKVKSLSWLIIMLIAFTISAHSKNNFRKQITSALKTQILEEANWALQQQPMPITDFHSPRSAGNIHDFYSEGDYWWPDSTNLEGPYVLRDGMTNPNNFTEHRTAMIRFSKIIGALASGYQLTGDDKFVHRALLHLKAWFINPETLMNPSLQFAQAIKGKVTGRGIGIIDTIHLIEVAQGVIIMEKSEAFDKVALTGVKKWFSDYLTWLTTHPYGKEEMNAENNHGTCWVMQVASFSKLVENNHLLTFCRERYKNILLAKQMMQDGSFPLELKRTKPYGYSIFNLDAMVMICQILSNKENNLWKYKTQDGKSIHKGIEFLYPSLMDKLTWAFQKDVMYWDNWPVAQPSLVFGAIAFNKKDWFETWQKLDHSPQMAEVVRNLPVRHPLIWLE